MAAAAAYREPSRSRFKRGRPGSVYKFGKFASSKSDQVMGGQGLAGFTPSVAFIPTPSPQLTQAPPSPPTHAPPPPLTARRSQQLNQARGTGEFINNCHSICQPPSHLVSAHWHSPCASTNPIFFACLFYFFVFLENSNSPHLVRVLCLAHTLTLPPMVLADTTCVWRPGQRGRGHPPQPPRASR
jgi:hypothetical protein